MSYSAGEGLVLSTLRLHANYNQNNTRRGNWKILTSGKDSFYVILRPGPFTVLDHGLGGGSGATTKRQANWITQVMVYQRYIDDGTSLTNLEARVDEIIAHLDKYRVMGDGTNTIQKARVVSGGEVEEVALGQKGPNFLRWILNVEWHEERSVTYSE